MHVRGSTISPFVSFWEPGPQNLECVRCNPFLWERNITFSLQLSFNVCSEASSMCASASSRRSLSRGWGMFLLLGRTVYFVMTVHEVTSLAQERCSVFFPVVQKKVSLGGVFSTARTGFVLTRFGDHLPLACKESNQRIENSLRAINTTRWHKGGKTLAPQAHHA